MAEEGDKQLVGKVTHYFTNIGVAVVGVEASIAVGDTLSFEGTTTNFQQKVDSMQVENAEVESVKKGDEIGMKVKDRVRGGDNVYKVG